MIYLSLKKFCLRSPKNVSGTPHVSSTRVCNLCSAKCRCNAYCVDDAMSQAMKNTERLILVT